MGYGKGNAGTKPKSGCCYCKYSFSDRAKALSTINKIEIVCKAGLKDLPTHHFALPLQQSKIGLYDCLLEFESYSITTGTERVFHIHTCDAKTINMFREFRKLTDQLIDEWCEDLDIGVVKGISNNVTYI